jgi:hypothetical protein
MKYIVHTLITLLLLSCSNQVKEKIIEKIDANKISYKVDSTISIEDSINNLDEPTEDTTYKPIKIEISAISHQEIKNFISRISDEYKIIKSLIINSNKDSILTNNNALLIKCHPCGEFEKFSLIIYPKAEGVFFKRYNKRHSKQLPKEYQDFLKSMNGCELFGMSLLGLTPSIYKNEVGTLNRSVFQCNDIGIANSFYKQEYDLKDKSLLLFGSGTLSYTENIGYFWDTNNGQIKLIRNNGEVLIIYEDFNSFLTTETQKSKEILEEIRTERSR